MSETGRGDSLVAVPMLTSTGSVGATGSRWTQETDLDSKEKEGDSGLVQEEGECVVCNKYESETGKWDGVLRGAV
jgi:hypothetical protein